jgi:deoxycytidylate deaminase
VQSKETSSGRLSTRDASFLALAVSLAGTSQCRNKHGAVIVRGGSVLATGINKSRNHPEVLSDEHVKGEASTHAEVDAIRHLSPHNDYNGAVAYIARVNRQGQTRMSRPCDACYLALQELGIKRIVFTLNEED